MTSDTRPLEYNTIKDFTPTHSYANVALQCLPILGFFLSRIQMQQDLAQGFSEAALCCRKMDYYQRHYISSGLGLILGAALISLTALVYLGIAIFSISTLILLFTCVQHRETGKEIDRLIEKFQAPIQLSDQLSEKIERLLLKLQQRIQFLDSLLSTNPN